MIAAPAPVVVIFLIPAVRPPGDDVHCREVVILASVGIHRRCRLVPGLAAIEGGGEVDVELLRPVVLPDSVEVAVGAVDGDAREVVHADVRPRNAFLRTAAQVAEWLAGRDVVADEDRLRPGGATIGGHDRELLGVGIVRRRVAVVEDHHDVAVGPHDGIGALVEVAGAE